MRSAMFNTTRHHQLVVPRVGSSGWCTVRPPDWPRLGPLVPPAAGGSGSVGQGPSLTRPAAGLSLQQTGLAIFSGHTWKRVLYFGPTYTLKAAEEETDGGGFTCTFEC